LGLSQKRKLEVWGALINFRSLDMLAFGPTLMVCETSTLGKTYGIECGAIGNILGHLELGEYVEDVSGNLWKHILNMGTPKCKKIRLLEDLCRFLVLFF
jgi:hypothetical protein